MNADKTKNRRIQMNLVFLQDVPESYFLFHLRPSASICG
jgi:hypothetical protein